MINQIEGYVLDQEITSPFILNTISYVKGRLSNPIDGLNIIGTSHPYYGVQIYGWRSPLPDHIDNTGHVLIMPIHISTGSDRMICAESACDLKVGHLYVLDDRKPHRTEGNGDIVALFMGSYKAKALNDELYQRVFNEFTEYLK